MWVGSRGKNPSYRATMLACYTVIHGGKPLIKASENIFDMHTRTLCKLVSVNYKSDYGHSFCVFSCAYVTLCECVSMYLAAAVDDFDVAVGSDEEDLLPLSPLPLSLSPSVSSFT